MPNDTSTEFTPNLRQMELLLWQMIEDFGGGEVSAFPPDDAPNRRVVFRHDGGYVWMTCVQDGEL
jgi:hypothetical protein